MRNFFSSAATVVGGILLVAVIVGGWAFYGVYRDQVPAPIRGVLDLVEGGGQAASPVAPLPDVPASQQQGDPLADCPEFGDDSTAIVRTMDGTDPAVQANVTDASNFLVTQLEEATAGRTPGAIDTTGAADALRVQTAYVHTTADALRGVILQTPQARALAVSMAAAMDQMAKADDTLLGSGTGTRTRLEWLDYGNQLAGPAGQVQVVGTALQKCPQ